MSETKQYGDTPEERARELIETGSSIRQHGKPIMTLIREALELDDPEPVTAKESSEGRAADAS